MDKEKIQARIKELETSRDQTRANLFAHEGAIQELTVWLNSAEEVKKED